MPPGQVVTTQVWPHSMESWYEVDYGFLKVLRKYTQFHSKHNLTASPEIYQLLPTILHSCEIAKQLSESGSCGFFCYGKCLDCFHFSLIFEIEPHYVNQVGLTHNNLLSSATQVLDRHRNTTTPGQVILYNTHLKEIYLNLKHDSHHYFRQTEKALDIIHTRKPIFDSIAFSILPSYYN